MLKKSVKEIMEANVISLPSKSPLSQALTLMADNNISFIVIASEENKPLGVITERDILKNVWNKQNNNLQISDVMSSPVFTTSVDEDVMTAIHTLVIHNIRHLVVVDKDVIIRGVLTLTNFLQKLGFEYFVDFKDIKEIMDPTPLTLPADTDAVDALSSLSRTDASCLIAMENDRPTGIFTERDALRITQEGRDLSGISLKKLMSIPVVYLQEGSCVFEALSVLNKNKVRHLPVINSDGVLLGLISQVGIAKGMELKYTAFLKKIIEEQEKNIKEANDHLEEKVAERTKELTKANEELQREVEERKLAEKALLESEQKYRSVIENIGVGVTLISPNMEIMALNRQMKEWVPHIDVTKKPACYTAFNDTSREKECSCCPTKKTLIDGEVHESLTETHSGEKTLNFKIVSSPIKDETGKVVAAIELVEDITEQKRIEEDLRRSQLYFQNLDRISRAISQASDVDSMIGEVVKEILEIFEVDRAWLLYPCDPEAPSWRVPVEVTVPDYPGAFVEQAEVPKNDTSSSIFSEALATDDPVAFDFSEYDEVSENLQRFNIQTQLVIALRPKAGKAWLLGMHQCSYKRQWDDDDKRLFKDIAERVRDSLTNLVLLKQLEEDITERKRVEERLSLLEKALKTTNMGVTITGLDGRIIYSNPADADMHGYLPEELKGKDVGILAPAEIRKTLTLNQIKTAKTKKRESVNIRKDGSTFPVYLISDIVKSTTGDSIGLVTTCEDITERKQAEEALRISKERYALAIEGSNDGIWERNLVTGETYFSPRWKETIGYRNGEFLNHVDEWKKRVHPDDYDMVIKNVDDYLAGTIDRYICEYRIRHKDDSWHWMLAKGAKACDDHGNPTRFAGSHTDITERKKAEEERKSLEAQLLQAQKMETIGTLAGGIAHDFNNILSPILICAEVALDDTPKDSETHETIETILKAANRAKDLVKRILLFSRSGEQNREKVKIKETVNEALKLARSSIPSTISIKKNINLRDETITADPIQIHQLIMNLCTNAFHAMHESAGKITVELSAIDIDNINNKLLHLNEGKYILLSVSDSGHGIDESTKQRIFDPFFTTKDTGKGTGLGLSIVLGIVMSHDGEITVESEVGKGSTFHIYLPQSVRDEAAELQSDEKADPKGVENILFIDDESAIGFVGKNALENLGYKVTALDNASEALELFRHKPDHFNIVISDYTMPNMTGLQLAIELKEIRQDIPVIIISGYNDTINEENMDSFNIDEYITKPFTGPQMGRAIRKVMAKRERH